MKYLASAIATICIALLLNTCIHESARNDRVRMQLDAVRSLAPHGDVVQPKL